MNYDPKVFFEELGRLSEPGVGDSPGKFGQDDNGYNTPRWSAPPQFIEYFKKGDKVLDVGSGTGYQVGKLIQHGIAAVGCDISATLIEVARQNCKSHDVAGAKFVQWDGQTLPFAAGEFDCATTNTVVQHVVDEAALRQIFSEVSRVLRPQGRFIISELMAPLDVQTDIHVKLRSVESYKKLAAQYRLQAREVRLDGSVFASLQAVYGALRVRCAPSQKSGGAAQGNLVPVAVKPTGWRALFKKAVIVSCQLADRPARFLKLDALLVSKATIVFQKE